MLAESSGLLAGAIELCTSAFTLLGLDSAFLAETVVPALNKGLLMSLALIIPSATIGFVLGVLVGVARVFGSPWLRYLGNGFTTLFRGVPLVVQLMILYFGLPNIGIYFEPYTASVLGFILCTGAYQSEYVRGALLSIRQGQLRAAYALGFTRLQTIMWIVVPQAARRALPGCGNEIIYLIKYSSLAYIITCIELTGEAKVVVSRTFRPTEVYLVAGVYYLALVSLATWGLNRLEQRYRIPGFGKGR